MSGKYDDIMSLPHHVSSTRPQMSRMGRAAQFSPFAALVGYSDAIDETARLTDTGPQHNEETMGIIDKKLRLLASVVHRQPEVTVTYFVADARKDGGAYLTARDRVKKVDPFAYQLILLGGLKIPFEDIAVLDCSLFESE